MNTIKLATIVLASYWLVGCSSLGGSKDSSGTMDGADVVIEDRSAGTSGVDNESISGSEFGGAETQVIVGEDSFVGDELNNPASPLSNRVVYFEYDSSSVRMEDQETLAAHAAYLGKNPNVTIRLIGHTDERGAREYNLALGERRALSIRQILMLQGASLDQFQVTSFGEERPAVEGDTEAAWQQNRRVELIYLGQ